MRKRRITTPQKTTASADLPWLNLEELAEVEISSEATGYPIEDALLPGRTSGWRAAESGKQTIRLLFDRPQKLHRIWLKFEESRTERVQEYVLRCSQDRGQSFQEIVRQQWNFNPQNASCESENHEVDLSGVTVIELIIVPDISGSEAFASLAKLRLA